MTVLKYSAARLETASVPDNCLMGRQYSAAAFENLLAKGRKLPALKLTAEFVLEFFELHDTTDDDNATIIGSHAKWTSTLDSLTTLTPSKSSWSTAQHAVGQRLLPRPHQVNKHRSCPVSNELSNKTSLLSPSRVIAQPYKRRTSADDSNSVMDASFQSVI